MAARVQIAHTGDLSAGTLPDVRALLAVAFEDGFFTDSDWEHALGGMHALVWEEDALVAHGALVQRRLLHAGRALRAGYVEAVAVRPDRRRRGYGAAVMNGLERVLRGAYEVGALSATEAGAALYMTLGWQRWQGPTSALTPSGITRTEDDDGGVYVLPVTARMDLAAALTCDWRDGDLW